MINPGTTKNRHIFPSLDRLFHSCAELFSPFFKKNARLAHFSPPVLLAQVPPTTTD